MRILRLAPVLAFAASLSFSPWAYAEGKPAKVEAPKNSVRAAPRKGMFWEAKGKNGSAYLLGSIHVADKQMYPLPLEIESAFLASDTLAVEADVGESEQAALQQKLLASAIYTDGTTLQSHVSKRTYGAVSKRLTEDGLDIKKLAMLKPWMVAMTMTAIAAQKMGLDPKLGLDMHFLNAARGQKSIVEIESIDEQIKLFNALSADQQDAFLLATANEIGKLKPQIQKLFQAWNAGDATAMDAIAHEDEKEHPELKPTMDAILTKRNKTMADRIAQFLESGRTYFVVVGSAHYVGDAGIVALLRAQGYEVTQK